VRGDMVKKRKKIRPYDSEKIHSKNIEKNLAYIQTVKPLDYEPKENQEVIGQFYREKSLDRKWEKRIKDKR
jgi:hypothetical protein